ncbi:MAG: lysophospholipid acyltransferase family protein [Mariprofundaceae bacterium]|nr:lysophospholipid acyltransferase family protein [Mariprofundaceae bacterium]
MVHQQGPNRFLRWLNRLFCRHWHRLESGNIILPDGPLILIGNHRCGLDPLLVQALVNRPLCFLMAREYYHGMLGVKWFFRMVGAIPVSPGGANRHALREAVDLLKAGGVLCIFPEGAANPDIPLKRIFPGAAMLALETDAPLLPFRVTGVWPFDHINIWKGLLRRSRATVRFGDIIQLALTEAPDRSDIRRGMKRVKEALHDLR